MALRTVIYLPDPRLRLPTEPVTKFDDELRALIQDMYETMYHENGVGLAATQIGLSIKLAVIDVSKDEPKPFCIVNPEIIEREGEKLMGAGCLSVPGGVYCEFPRAERVKVRAQNERGETFELEADGLLAHCLQHEIDHLNGKLIVDYLSPLKRLMAQKKMDKFFKKQKDKE